MCLIRFFYPLLKKLFVYRFDRAEFYSVYPKTYTRFYLFFWRLPMFMNRNFFYSDKHLLVKIGFPCFLNTLPHDLSVFISLQSSILVSYRFLRCPGFCLFHFLV